MYPSRMIDWNSIIVTWKHIINHVAPLTALRRGSKSYVVNMPRAGGDSTSVNMRQLGQLFAGIRNLASSCSLCIRNGIVYLEPSLCWWWISMLGVMMNSDRNGGNLGVAWSVPQFQSVSSENVSLQLSSTCITQTVRSVDEIFYNQWAQSQF